MNTQLAITPNVGDIVQPSKLFANRPACIVVEIVRDNSRPYLGRGFIAQYPNGERHLQWDGDHNARFDTLYSVEQRAQQLYARFAVEQHLSTPWTGINNAMQDEWRSLAREQITAEVA